MDDSAADGYMKNCDDHCNLSMLMELSSDFVKVKAVKAQKGEFNANSKELKNEIPRTTT